MVLSTTLQYCGKWMMQSTLPTEKGPDSMWLNSNKIPVANDFASTYRWKGGISLMDFDWKLEGKRDRQAVKFSILPLTYYK